MLHAEVTDHELSFAQKMSLQTLPNKLSCHSTASCALRFFLFWKQPYSAHSGEHGDPLSRAFRLEQPCWWRTQCQLAPFLMYTAIQNFSSFMPDNFSTNEANNLKFYQTLSGNIEIGRKIRLKFRYSNYFDDIKWEP